MRGDPERLNAEYAEQARAARDRFASERESYRAEAEADAAAELTRLEFWVSEAERIAYKTGLAVGRKDERNRIATALSAAEQETAALWQEGTPVTKAVAAYTAAVRRVVEGRT